MANWADRQKFPILAYDRLWPSAAICGVENCTSSISAYWLEADRRYSLLCIAENGHKRSTVAVRLERKSRWEVR